METLLAVRPGRALSEGQSARWQAEINYAAALSVTPPAATPGHLAELEKQKLDTLEQLDLLQSAAFFAWANRLMLTLGEPGFPEKIRPAPARWPDAFGAEMTIHQQRGHRSEGQQRRR